MKKKGFTLLELIIVIGIILVLILSFRNVFQNSNKDFLYAETCINKIYGDINNFIFSAITSRGLYIENNIIYPKQYIINVQTNDKINFEYTNTENQSGIYLIDNLSSNELKNTYCNTDNYNIIFSGNNFELNINKEAIHDNSLSTFTINDGQNSFTKDINFLLCYTGNKCKEIAKFTIDTRTQSLQKKICIRINPDEFKCLQRDK